MNTILYFIECCCYYSQRLTTLQSFWWHCSTRLAERIDDHCTQQHCCCCSWQLTKGPHGLSYGLEPLRWSCITGLWWHMWRTKPLNGTVTLLANIRLASASAACLINCCCVVAYAGWAVAWTLRQRASALFVHQVHFRAHRSVMPIA